MHTDRQADRQIDRQIDIRHVSGLCGVTHEDSLQKGVLLCGFVSYIYILLCPCEFYVICCPVSAIETYSLGDPSCFAQLQPFFEIVWQVRRSSHGSASFRAWGQRLSNSWSIR